MNQNRPDTRDPSNEPALSGVDRPEAHPKASDPQDIRQDIAKSRQRIDQTIEALARRVSPAHMMKSAMSAARPYQHELAASVVHTVRHNRVPLVVSAAGLSWLLVSSLRQPQRGQPEAGRRTKAHTSAAEPGREPGAFDAELRARTHLYEAGMESQGSAYEYEGGPSTAASSAPKPPENPGDNPGHESPGHSDKPEHGKLSRKGSAMAHKFHERTQQIGEQVGQRTRQVRDQLRDQFDQASAPVRERGQQAGQMLRDHPLALAAGVLAVGLLAGLAIPTSERERKAMEGPRREAGRRAREYSEELAERGGELAQRSSDQAAEAVERAADQASEAASGGESEGSRGVS